MYCVILSYSGTKYLMKQQQNLLRNFVVQQIKISDEKQQNLLCNFVVQQNKSFDEKAAAIK